MSLFSPLSVSSVRELVEGLYKNYEMDFNNTRCEDEQFAKSKRINYLCSTHRKFKGTFGSG